MILLNGNEKHTTIMPSIHTLSPTDFLKIAHRTAQHFGFSPIEMLVPPPRTRRLPSQKATTTDRKLDALHGALTAGVTAYFERALHDERPALFFSIYEIPRTQVLTFGLQVIGVRKSVAESLLIQTLRSLIRDLGYPNHCVRINSLGDRDSVARYTRELTAYLRKRLADMPLEARELLKEDCVGAFLHLIAIDHELCAKSPSPLEYLSDASRRHFREVIEHLDMTETPYEIDPHLMGHHHCYADTLFAFELHDAEDARIPDAPLTIRGGRLDAFVTHILNRDVPATGAVIILNGKYAPTRMPRPGQRPVPSIFMIQLGFGPKIRSLMLLNQLKTADIPVHQALVSDSLSEQLRQAESYNVPFSIILGQKEFVENSIIVRDMRSRSQQTIPFDILIPHLKRLLKRV